MVAAPQLSRTSSETGCCVVGGGPAGVVLALLLARAGVSVTLLESHQTFERDFRGDTIHPALLELLDEIGLAEALHQRPHVKMYGPTLPGMGDKLLFDFRQLLRTRFPYIMWMPQPIFLAFLAEQAQRYPGFRLIMGARVQELIKRDGVVQGVRYQAADGWHDLRALLTVGADGRFSRVRKLAGFEPVLTSSPVELLWLRLPRLAGDPPTSGIASPRFGTGLVMVLVDRADHWQVGVFFPVGRYQELRAAGVEALRASIVGMEPKLSANVQALTSWEQVSLLSVAQSRCRVWYRPGLLLIGDAAHTMTPAAGAGIKLAIEDAVVASNVLGPELKGGQVRLASLAEVQRQRQCPTRVTQAVGAFGLRQIGRALRSGRPLAVPSFVPRLFGVRAFARVAAHMLAFGVRRVRIREI